MIYLFSSQPKVLVEYFKRHSQEFTLVEKRDFESFVADYQPKAGDLGIVCDFGLFIPQSLLDQMLVLNVHFSLLPQYRGAIPVEAAILAGEQKTGITIQRMVAKMDRGDILVQQDVKIQQDWTSGDLQEHMYSKLPEVLDKVFSAPQEQWEFTPQQGEGSVCYIRWLDRPNALLKPKELTAKEFVQRVLGYNPEPIAWMEMEKKGEKVEVNILNATLYDESMVPPGQIQFVKKKGVVVGTKDGSVLITELVVAGSKPLRGGDIVALKGILRYGDGDSETGST
jgi:methionyl-tRNA formyltransferase